MNEPAPIDLNSDSGIKEDVAFFIFNRPELTEQVFAEIARYQPARLFVVSDGPRDKKEAAVCEKTRAVIDRVDWDCEVLRNFSETNLGCKERVSSGLRWVFEHSERAIILEDDCLPDPSFFGFCSALLEHYKDDERVMHIGGSNFAELPEGEPATYYFSRHSDIWGWATWRRAFALYDLEMESWPAVRENLQNSAFGNDQAEINFWTSMFDQTATGAIDTWDFQWHYTVSKNRGLSCVPRHNLISNLGWGDNATHTVNDGSIVSQLPTRSLTEIRHPRTFSPDESIDAAFFYTRYYHGSFFVEIADDIEDDRLRVERREDAINLLLVHGAGARSAPSVVGLALGTLPPKALDATRLEGGFMAALLRRLCRIKLLQGANRALHRASLAGQSALSEMTDALVPDHFAIPELLRDIDTPLVIDAGCHHGAGAAKLKRLFPHAKVVAFDPNQESPSALADADVKFLPCALAGIPGDATFYRDKKDPGGPAGSFSREVTLFRGSGKLEEETVECTTLDYLLPALNLHRVDLLYLSVNGLEWEVLFGAVDSMRNGSLPAIIFAFGPAQALTATPMVYFIDQLREYKLYRMTPNKLARLEPYDFVTSEIFTEQHILAVAPYHPRKDAIRKISRR